MEIRYRPDRRVTRDALATQLRIQEAAHRRFATCSYERVGLRGIARDAGVDVALIVRYFGSKQRLFQEVADQAFAPGRLMSRRLKNLPYIATQLIFYDDASRVWNTHHDPLGLLLHSIGSPTAGPILTAALAHNLLEPVRAALDGAHVPDRTTMIGAQILGMALMHLMFRSDEVAVNYHLHALFSDSLALLVRARNWPVTGDSPALRSARSHPPVR